MNERTWRTGFAGARAGWGIALLLAPDRIVRVLSGRPPTTAARVVARVLGARQLTQACASALWPGSTARALGLVTDVLHSLSGLAFALLPTRWRRGALLDASLAALFAAGSGLGSADE